jgi:hypothetical protein
MSRVHPMSAMTEVEWSRAWHGEQKQVDQLRSRRGSWLPNVVEIRDWGAIRWTSGRPRHAADTGQAVAETFVVVNPERKAHRDAAAVALRDPAPVAGFAGFTLRREPLLGAAIGAAVGLLIGVLIVVLASFPVIVGVLVVLVLAAAGAVAGGFVGRHLGAQARTKAMGGSSAVRTITGRYAPASWSRLVVAATALESSAAASATTAGGAPDAQSADAVHHALWEAAGLLLGSSDHTGVEVLADGVERLADAHRI